MIGEERSLFEGFGLRFDDGQFIWYFTERGKAEILKTFASEQEACEYVFEQIKSDRYGRSHMVGFLENEQLKDEFCIELKNREIEFETDKIHYQQGIYKHRIFVFGCDWKKVEDLKTKYQKLETETQWQKKL
jgi:hypothetical protein